MTKLFSSQGFQPDLGLLIVRCVIGFIMIRYGLELFDEQQMKGYHEWLTDLHFPRPDLLAALGKVAELLGGISLILGLLIRLFAIPVVITMVVITFVMGEKDITSSSFAYLMIYMLFFFVGTGKYSLDQFFNAKRSVVKQRQQSQEIA